VDSVVASDAEHNRLTFGEVNLDRHVLDLVCDQTAL